MLTIHVVFDLCHFTGEWFANSLAGAPICDTHISNWQLGIVATEGPTAVEGRGGGGRISGFEGTGPGHGMPLPSCNANPTQTMNVRRPVLGCCDGKLGSFECLSLRANNFIEDRSRRVTQIKNRVLPCVLLASMEVMDHAQKGPGISNGRDCSCHSDLIVNAKSRSLKP